MKKTMNELISQRKISKPKEPVWSVLRVIAGSLYYKKCGVEIHRSVDPNAYKDKPVIVVANHASRMDYAFVNYAMKGRRINFVAAENEFHRSHLSGVFKLGQVIPKKNFVPDMTTIKGMSRIIKKEKNGCVAIFPCGMSTATGAQQPSAIGSGKMLKHFGVHVLAIRIHGGFFVSPKWDVKERYGKVEIELFELFNPEQLKQLSEEQIQLKLDEAIFTDDYAWNETRQHSYKCKTGMATHLEQLMYICPKCGAELQMKGEGDEIKCLACGNGGTLDHKYNLIPNEGSVLPKNLRIWFDDQRRTVRQQALQDGFVLEEHVKIGTMQKYGLIPKKGIGNIVGDGTLRLDKSGLTFDGTRDGQPYKVFIKSSLIPTICFPVDASFFYTYAHEGEFLYFIPDTLSCTKWLLSVEEVYRTNGGKWQNYPWFNYKEETPLAGYPLSKD